MAHMQNIDVLLKEFLLYRGFSGTLKQFENECRSDKNKNFRSDKILESINSSIQSSDLNELRDTWKHLENFVFNKLEQNYSEAVKKLENGIYKYYLVVAHINNRTDKIQDFFIKMSSELHAQNEWKDFFYFPYCKVPDENPSFAVYFTKQWQDTLLLSLHNFLATIFQSMPLPILIRTEVETAQIRKLQDENTKLRQRIQSMQQQTASGIASSNHQSRISSFYDKKYGSNLPNIRTITNPNDIIPFDINPPVHLVDDFFQIAQETLSMSDSQARSFKSLIRNISSGSPVLGRKDHSVSNEKRSSGSTSKLMG